MEKHKLKTEKRKIEGRKVKQLRKVGLLPANVYGKDFKSLSVQLPVKDFLAVYKEAKETGVIELSVGEEQHPVLIHNVQLHPVTGAPLHADFHRISLTEKVKATVSVVMVGEAPAVTQKLGLLLTPVSELEVEALPADLPEKIEVDVTGLAAVGQEIKLVDLKLSAKISLTADPEMVLVKIGELITEEAKKEMEAEKAAAEAAAVAAAPAAETAPAEGEAPKETPTPEVKPKTKVEEKTEEKK